MFVRFQVEGDDEEVKWSTVSPSSLDKSEFKVQEHPFVEVALPTRRSSSFVVRFWNWIRRKRLSVNCVMGGLMNMQEHKIYPVDFLAEKNGETVLVIVYSTPKCDKASYNHMKEYADKVGNTCHDDYKMACRVWLLHVDGKIKLRTHEFYYGPPDQSEDSM